MAGGDLASTFSIAVTFTADLRVGMELEAVFPVAVDASADLRAGTPSAWSGVGPASFGRPAVDERRQEVGFVA